MRDKAIFIRMSEAERDLLKKVAKHLGLNISQAVRYLIRQEDLRRRSQRARSDQILTRAQTKNV